MENQYNPLQCIFQLNLTLRSLAVETRLLQDLLKRYSTEDVNTILPSVLNKLKNSIEFEGKVDLEKEALVFFSKFQKNFTSKLSKEQEDMCRLKMQIQEDLKNRERLKQQSQNMVVYPCLICEQTFHGANGLHNHQIRTHQKENKRGEVLVQRPKKTKPLGKKDKKSGPEAPKKKKNENIFEDQ